MFNVLTRQFRCFSAVPMNGKEVHAKVIQQIAAEVKALKRPPGLAVVLVGERDDSKSYVSLKKKAALACGFFSVSANLSEKTTQEELLSVVDKLNADPMIDGILVQLPLPVHIEQKKILQAISSDKDVDGFHPTNLGRLCRQGEELRQTREKFDIKKTQNFPCTPLGCMELLESYGVDPAGKHAVVLGRSNIVGLPMAVLLLHKDATVTIAHSKTENLRELCRSADILVAAIGKAEMVKEDWIKTGAVVLDVGVSFVADKTAKSGKRICGDVAYPEVSKVASFITPVPGGVGPMTVAMLMRNTLANAKHNQS